MGIRSRLKKELMNLDALGLMTADDVRRYLAHSTKQFRLHSVKIIARFNAHHNKVLAGVPSQEAGLKHQQHKLFKEVLYAKQDIQNWLARSHAST